MFSFSVTRKRECAASLLAHLGILKCSEAMRFGAQPLVLLAYHGVRDIDPSDYPFDEGTVSASCHQFDLQMGFVKKNYDVITFEDLMAYREGKCALPKRPLIITFDDGFADNYQNAFPILKAHHLPAIIFLVSGLVGTNEIFWWEKVVYWYKSSNIFFERWREIVHLTHSEENWTQKRVLRYLKDLSDGERIRVLTEMENAIPIPQTPYSSGIRPLQWSEVSEMSQSQIMFGSHTVTHPLLSKVSKEKLRFELEESKKTIEEKTGQAVSVLAYPVGGPSDYNDEVISVAKAVGYRFGITYYPEEKNSRSPNDWFRIGRISIERDYLFNRFRCRLSFLFP